MKAITIHSYGGPDSLVYEDVPIPVVSDTQILVEVMATTVNHIDIMQAAGKMNRSHPLQFPWIPGADLSGRVDYVGRDVTDIKPGDMVYGKVMEGTYAGYVAVDGQSVAPMPSTLSFAEAATVPHVGLTAWQALFEHGKLEPGQTVLVHGASGAVGSFAVQFAKAAGGYIFAVDKGENTDFLISLGADEVIDYTQADFTQMVSQIDLVLDFVGHDTASRSYPIMKKGGRLVSTVANPDPAQSGEYGIEANYMGVHPDRQDLSEITRLIEEGKVRTDVAEIFPLREAPLTWNIITHLTEPPQPFSHGKIVLSTE